MSEFFGNYKRPKAELIIIDKFIQLFNQSRKEYKSKNYQKALSGFKLEYEMLKDIWDIHPKIELLYLIVKCKFKLNDYKDCDLYLIKLNESLNGLYQFKKKIFLKFKSKFYLYYFILNFILDDLEKSINTVIEMITYLKESELFSLEEKIYFFWIYIKGFIKFGDKNKSKKFLLFKEQYDSMLVEETNEKIRYNQGFDIKEQKIIRGFVEEYKSFMNSKMRQFIYENLDIKYNYVKYGKINPKIIQFLNKNIDIYIKSDKKDKLIEKMKGFLMVTKIDLNENINLSMNQLIQEQKRRILAFNTIFSNIVGAFNHIFKNYLTDKEITFKQISHSKSMQTMYGNKEIKEMEEKLSKYIRKIKPIDLNSKGDNNKIKLNSLNYKEITLPYNFKREINIPPIIDNDKITKRQKNKKLLFSYSNIGKNIKFPFVKNRNNNIIRIKNEENKNSVIKFKKMRRSISTSLIKSNKVNTSEIITLYKNKKKKNELIHENILYRNINYYLISKLIEIYKNILNIKEIDIKDEKNYSKILPRKNDLYNFNISNYIKEHNVYSIQGTNSKNDNQDSSFFYEDFLLIKNFYLFGICDGHGKNGEQISKAISFLFPSFINYLLIEDNLNKKKQDINDMILNLFKLEESPKEIKDIFILRYISDKLKINYNLYPFLTGNLKLLSQLLYESCYYIQKELVGRYHYEIEYSGSTLCSGFLLGKILYISNIGDSRAILGNYDWNSNKWTCKQLSFEHVPSYAKEMKRIMINDGKIERLKNELGEEIGPLRIFQKEKDNMLPGISMTRSIGDSIAKTLGVTFEPEIFKYELDINDKVIIIGSDGFWAYMSNDEVINLIGEYYNDGIKSEEASIKMVENAKNKWIEENKKNPSLFNFNNKFKNGKFQVKRNKKDSYTENNTSVNYENPKEKKYYYDDITCMIIYLEII